MHLCIINYYLDNFHSQRNVYILFEIFVRLEPNINKRVEFVNTNLCDLEIERFGYKLIDMHKYLLEQHFENMHL